MFAEFVIRCVRPAVLFLAAVGFFQIGANMAAPQAAYAATCSGICSSNAGAIAGVGATVVSEHKATQGVITKAALALTAAMQLAVHQLAHVIRTSLFSYLLYEDVAGMVPQANNEILYGSTALTLGYTPEPQFASITENIKQMAQRLTGNTAESIGAMNKLSNADNSIQWRLEGDKQKAETRRHFKILNTNGCAEATSRDTLVGADVNANKVKVKLERAYSALGGARQGSSAAGGPSEAKRVQIAEVRDTYCDPNENNGNFGAAGVCNGGNEALYNLDFQSQRLLFSDEAATLDEVNYDALGNVQAQGDLGGSGDVDFFSLASDELGKYLYTSSLGIGPIQEAIYRSNAENFEKLMFDYRSIRAKRSLAMVPYNELLAMKAPMNKESSASAALGEDVAQLRAYMSRALINNPDPSAAASGSSLGQTLQKKINDLGDNPSLYSILKLVSRDIFLSPNWRINLAKLSENDLRKTSLHLRSTSMIVQWEMLESMRRQEMLLSQLVEEQVRAEQDSLAADLGLQ